MKILEECKGAKRIGISGHIRPDGDCVGSCMAMALFLRKAMPGTVVDVFLDKPSEIFDCIKEVDTIKNESTDEKYDVFIAIDCAAERFSFGQEMFEAATKTINIDHHITNTGCADVNYIFPESGSAAELVYEVLDTELMDRDIALAIYIGIIHDTGVLQYQNTRPKTLRTVANLIEYGFDFPNIITQTFYEKTYIQSQMMGIALLNSKRAMDDKCIYSMLNLKTIDDYGASSKDFEGIVNQLRNIKGVDCAIFAYEIAPKEYKISLRTSEKIDASVVTSAFGGGGHARAAGVTISGDYDHIINNLIDEINKQMN